MAYRYLAVEEVGGRYEPPFGAEVARGWELEDAGYVLGTARVVESLVGWGSWEEVVEMQDAHDGRSLFFRAGRP